ncbi:MAG: hypothetical protein AMJ90_08475 [candidate division Zixibacteria bacterium SM23_73_2]|nr:MAG: hypothetical protein AMJ90_08475 [candidate division Zixibacteria bacterium SM23_73_2]
MVEKDIIRIPKRWRRPRPFCLIHRQKDLSLPKSFGNSYAKLEDSFGFSKHQNSLISFLIKIVFKPI